MLGLKAQGVQRARQSRVHLSICFLIRWLSWLLDRYRFDNYESSEVVSSLYMITPFTWD